MMVVMIVPMIMLMMITVHMIANQDIITTAMTDTMRGVTAISL
jgi:hypothetical protein